jgi:hypothetical protein
MTTYLCDGCGYERDDVSDYDGGNYCLACTMAIECGYEPAYISMAVGD